MKHVEFYFDYSCPYAYLASTQIRALAEQAGARLEYKPFLLGGVFRTLGGAAPNLATMPGARVRQNAIDMQRWAAHWRVPLNMPPTHPNRTVTALRATLASDDMSRAMPAL
jgi:2-hydroxychromene-2-carboxylate isomerase